MKIAQIPSVNYSKRHKNIQALVLHCSTHEAVPMIKFLKQKRLSAHYVVGTDGRIFQLVDEQEKAWHAGVSRWRNMDNLNHYSIGIEISSPSMGQENYPNVQIKAVENLCRLLIRRYNIPAANIVAHSDIAPTRKSDPGKAFPWQYLAENNIGLWYDLADADKIKEDNVAILLNYIGYDVSNLAAASYAFCRHFLPHLIEKNNNIDDLLCNVYLKDFVFPKQYLPHLKACVYKFKQCR